MVATTTTLNAVKSISSDEYIAVVAPCEQPLIAVLFESQMSYSFKSISMLQSLHTMVIPDRHCKTFSELSISIKNIPNFSGSCSMHSLSKIRKIYATRNSQQ